ncbi:MAG: D-alanyl-D-alanine carboxypeptidase [Spirochaetales bacterium]|nr:D-alanyl-D-alanine carboxypeptidase [Spirochaetales bacterium]
MRSFIIFTLLGLTVSLTAQALDSRLSDLVPMASRAVLMDVTSGRILYQKNAEEPLPPASLTKLMTMHLIFEDIASGKLSMNEVVHVTSATDARAMPPGSSLMFLQAGQLVTIRELLIGLDVDSGNDAGLTLAVFDAGSQKAFVKRMNAEAARLGLTHTVYYDSYGYDSRNRTTAGDLAKFCRYFLKVHPNVLAITSQKELAYPLADNYPAGYRGIIPTIWQKNRNELLWTYPGADGLKTGYIDESGYNLVGTAERNGQRLLAIVLGVQARTTAQGSRLRTKAGEILLNYGFQRYPLVQLPVPLLPSVKAWYVQGHKVIVQPQKIKLYPLSAEERAEITVQPELPSSVIGPFPAHTKVGTLVWSLPGKVVTSVNLVSVSSGHPGSWWQDFWDAIQLFFRGLFGHQPPLNLTSANK